MKNKIILISLLLLATVFAQDKTNSITLTKEQAQSSSIFYATNSSPVLTVAASTLSRFDAVRIKDWLTINDTRKPVDGKYPNDLLYKPEVTIIESTAEPVVRKLENGKYEITFKPIQKP